jgi:hypothetical protein
MKVFVLFTSDTFLSFNVFLRSIMYKHIDNPTVKTVGFLVDLMVKEAGSWIILDIYTKKITRSESWGSIDQSPSESR